MSDLFGGDATVYARASAQGRSGVAVFRVSGPGTGAIIKALFGAGLNPRKPVLRYIPDTDGTPIDQGLVLFFPGPNSFTGEDVLELQLHGSRAVELALYRRLSELGARLADPGEFSLRALKNGKLDLTQIEALGDLLEAETDAQRRQALGHLGGTLSEASTTWRDLLLKIMANIAADIDFADEEGVPAAVSNAAGHQIDTLIGSLSDKLDKARAAKQIREGVRVVLLGAPNAGKSSLLNRMAGHEAAIVSGIPGTTRDIIEVRLDIEGQLILLSDTAGLREDAVGDIEQEGIRRSRARAEEADIVLHIVDASQDIADSQFVSDFQPEADVIQVLNKSDLASSLPKKDMPKNAIVISAKTGEGVPALFAALKERLKDQNLQDGGVLARQRHVDLVRDAVDALQRAKGQLTRSPELASEDLRMANAALSRLTGAIGVEDVLGEIFSTFCIGK